jgi:Tfp pilus assembly protein PilN
MPFINLIQEQRQEAKKNETRSRMFFLSFVGSAVLSVGVLGFFMFQNEMLKGEESDLRAKQQKLQPLVKRIEANQADYAELSPRLQTLEGAQLVTGRWSRILDHLTRQTPNETWLTAVRCVAPDPTKPVNITFAGLSARQELIGDFILRLQSCPDLSAVTLRFTQEKMAASGRDIEFEITSDISGTAEEVKEEIKKEVGDEKAA